MDLSHIPTVNLEDFDLPASLAAGIADQRELTRAEYDALRHNFPNGEFVEFLVFQEGPEDPEYPYRVFRAGGNIVVSCSTEKIGFVVPGTDLPDTPGGFRLRSEECVGVRVTTRHVACVTTRLVG